MKDVKEASVHCRRRGSCHSRRFSTHDRTIQIGNWWLTSTASCPRARSRAPSSAPFIRTTWSTYGSPHDGLKGLTRCFQFSGFFSAPSPTPKVLPWKTFSASMSRSSVAMSSPCVLAIGVAVCWARSSGDAQT